MKKSVVCIVHHISTTVTLNAFLFVTLNKFKEAVPSQQPCQQVDISMYTGSVDGFNNYNIANIIFWCSKYYVYQKWNKESYFKKVNGARRSGILLRPGLRLHRDECGLAGSAADAASSVVIRHAHVKSSRALFVEVLQQVAVHVLAYKAWLIHTRQNYLWYMFSSRNRVKCIYYILYIYVYYLYII